MAEVKNSFLRGKMNKDLDDRLIPNGEYRDAQNLQVSRSEGPSVGALENILGNVLVSITGNTDSQSSVIGYYVNSIDNSIIIFLTDFIDSSATGLNSFAPSTALCHIYKYSVSDNTYARLVTGSFLNFSKKYPIIGVNVLESLLFWTDNRNQPRKINIETAVSNPVYYTTEEQISVAKYAPINPISLLNIYEDQAVVGVKSGISNPTERFLPTNVIGSTTTTGSSLTVLSLKSNNGLTPIPYDGVQVTIGSRLEQLKISEVVSTDSNLINTVNPNTVISVSPAGSDPYNVTMAANFSLPNASTYVAFSPPNPDYDAAWDGDPDFITDIFPRFSYRFKFDDGEFSLMAPFTQSVFVPKQSGYFIQNDEALTFKSTVVGFMENNAKQIILNIPFDTATPSVDYKIVKMQILFKESDALAVKVIDEVNLDNAFNVLLAASNTGKVYKYIYKGSEPFKTLPSDQTTRVFDKVPVRALSQEVISNRIVYGNYFNKYSPPSTIDYSISSGNKLNTFQNSEIQYPNNTLKQNRTYQVGVVLADKFGRESSVVLSPTSDLNTLYLDYGDGGNTLTWPGTALRATFNTIIPNTASNINGYAGLYKNDSRGVDIISLTNPGGGYSVGLASTSDTTSGGLGGSGLTLNITAVSNIGAIQGVTIANVGSGYAQGQVVNVVQAGGSTATVTLEVFNPNPTGWYSYKIVVKQTEQEYYNVYLPGVMAGYPIGSISNFKEAGVDMQNTSQITLFNDNINKIPRDLVEVGPDQKSYRSASRVFPRVTPVISSPPIVASEQYDGVSRLGFEVSSISTLLESNFNGLNNQQLTVTTGTGSEGTSLNYKQFFNAESNPLIARLTTDQQFGLAGNLSNPFGQYPSAGTSPNETVFFSLGVVETEPVTSLLDIYWETSQTGIISELNALISATFSGAISLTTNTPLFNEGMCSGTALVSNVGFINTEGIVMQNIASATISSVIGDDGVNYTGRFTIAFSAASDTFTISSDDVFYCSTIDASNVFNFILNVVTTGGDISNLPLQITLDNIAPNIITSYAATAAGRATRTADNYYPYLLKPYNQGTNVYNILPSSTTIVDEFAPVNGVCENATRQQRTQGLSNTSMELVSQTLTDGTALPDDYYYLVAASGKPSVGNYTATTGGTNYIYAWNSSVAGGGLWNIPTVNVTGTGSGLTVSLTGAANIVTIGGYSNIESTASGYQQGDEISVDQSALYSAASLSGGGVDMKLILTVDGWQLKTNVNEVYNCGTAGTSESGPIAPRNIPHKVTVKVTDNRGATKELSNYYVNATLDNYETNQVPGSTLIPDYPQASQIITVPPNSGPPPTGGGNANGKIASPTGLVQPANKLITWTAPSFMYGQSVYFKGTLGGLNSSVTLCQNTSYQVPILADVNLTAANGFYSNPIWSSSWEHSLQVTAPGGGTNTFTTNTQTDTHVTGIFNRPAETEPPLFQFSIGPITVPANGGTFTITPIINNTSTITADPANGSNIPFNLVATFKVPGTNELRWDNIS